jgi:anti-anti-sigma factor
MNPNPDLGGAGGEPALEARREGVRAIVILRGRVDSSAADPLVTAVCDALREGPEELSLELAEVTFVSSAGIGGILRSHSEAKRAGVRFRVTSISEAARGVFRLARIEQMLLGPAGSSPTAAPPAPAAAAARTVSYDAWKGRFRPLDPRATATVRALANESVLLGAHDLAIGVGCLGDATQLAEVPRRGGEMIAVGAAAANLPTDTDLIDYLAAHGGAGCPVSFGDGLAVHGPMRWAIDLTEVRHSGVGLSSLARECLDLCGSDAAAIVVAAEAAGVVGAYLRTPPGAGEASIRNRLAFTSEPLHEGDTVAIAGIAVRVTPKAEGSTTTGSGKRDPIHESLRLVGDGLHGHFHALAVSYRPIPIEPGDPAPLVGALIAEQRPLGLYHLVNDDRSGGAGETRVRRGTVFCVPLANGGSA